MRQLPKEGRQKVKKWRPATVLYHLGNRIRHKNVSTTAMKKIINLVSPESPFKSASLMHSPLNNKVYHIYDFNVYFNLDILFVTETWQLAGVSPAYKAATPLTHKFQHVIWPGTVSGTSGVQVLLLGDLYLMLSFHAENSVLLNQ